ncbi:DUF4139 domain-containing protein [Hydrogenimonas sp. SS33]|uniref:DUF4139 domain-containing protein n=1 Tax=Hydrogenimonas leucolamina TaxID=2954236 RepID=UPI00336C12BC
MKRWLALAMAGMAAAAWGSTFELYTDGARYTFAPRQGFLGFVSPAAKLVCGKREMRPFFGDFCPEKSKLCRLRGRIVATERAVVHAERSQAYLQSLLDHAAPKNGNAKTFIDLAKRSGEAYAGWEMEKRANQRRLKALKNRMRQMAPSMEPAAVPDGCGKEVTLKLPAGSVALSMLYEADLGRKGEVGVTQYLKLTNRSGIDIDAREARFFFKPMHRYLRPIRFSPWIVRDATARPKVRNMKRVGLPMAAMATDMAQAQPVPVTKISARRYEVKGLHLPSDGREREVAVSAWHVKAAATETVYPYRDPRVYKVVRFVPKEPLEGDRWRIVKGGEILSTDATGLYEGGKYTLFVDVDEDVKVRRDRKVLKAKESFFGGSIHKKDGYRIEVTNSASETKKITIVDRIPVAPQPDVTVKLVKIDADAPIRYRLGEEGKVTIDLTLKGASSARVDVVFEVVYEKGKKINY